MNYNDSIYKLAEKLHWLQIADDGVLEFFLDNHMLQTFRACEAKFFEEFVEGYRSKAGRVWFLEFGTCVHEAVEYFYKNRTKPGFNPIDWSINVAKEIWTRREMDYWADDSLWPRKKGGTPDNAYKTLGGFLGFSSMMLQYTTTFNLENDRFRVIGAELYFGKNKEVPLYETPLSTDYFEDRIKEKGKIYFPFRIYLAGKIDLLMDDGFNIGPMDHKTAKDFMGKNPAHNYEIQDGMTGYVFASKKILDAMYMDESVGIFPSRNCNKIWMNFLQVKPVGKDEPLTNRFKRIPIFKTDWELEEYRQRQISTVARIYQLLENYHADGTGLRPNYNTMMCTNMMHRDCPFQQAHRQNSRESRLIMLNTDFIKDQTKVWNPEQIED